MNEYLHWPAMVPSCESSKPKDETQRVLRVAGDSQRAPHPTKDRAAFLAYLKARQTPEPTPEVPSRFPKIETSRRGCW